ncbi:MAG: T9SS type A sorting domain-containing protein [Flavobacteriales bacterium]|nr:T9SS type A sorting domain-containing protein [Flavobacteriales bacterium]
MNRILIFLLICVNLSAYAQVTDTLGYSEFFSGTDTLYESPNGGFAFGNNGYGDKAKAQTYSDTNSFVLREVWMLFGEVSFGSGDSASVIHVNVYENRGVGVSASTSDSVAPSSILGSVDIPIHQLLDDGNFSIADFTNTTLVIYEPFSVGIDMSDISPGDTVGLISTTDGDAGGSSNAWEKTANDVWFTVDHATFSWGLDVDLAIFPVIDENDPAGISEKSELEWSIYPNPSRENIWLRLPHNEQWQMTIRDVLGKAVFEASFFGRSNSVNVSQFDKGIYFLSVSNKQWTSTKRLIVN